MILNFIKNADMFGQPFRFHTDSRIDQKNLLNKTAFGSLISLLCILLGLAYFVFLIEEYISGRVPPQVSKIQVENTGIINETFDKKPMTVYFKTPQAYANEDLSQYVNFYLVSVGALDNQTIPLQNKNITTVGDQNLYTYIIDEVNSISLQVDPLNKKNNQYFQIVAQMCQINCKTDAEIDAFFQDDDTELEIQLYFQEVNVHSGKFEDKSRNIFSAIDSQINQMLDLQMIISQIDKDTGFLWRVSTIQQYTEKYSQHSEYFSPGYFEKRFGADNPVFKDAVKIINMRLAKENSEYVIVYEKFSQVIAKFLAVFNSIIIIGLLGKMGSESKMFESIVDQYLINYYKKSAANIYDLRKLEEKELIEKKQREGNNNLAKVGAQNNTTPQFQNVLPKILDPVLNFFTHESTVIHQLAPSKYQKYVNSIEQNTAEKNQNLLQEENTTKDQQKPQKSLQELKKDVYIANFKRCMEIMDYRILYKEIIQLKSNLQLLFTPEQYAALNYVGRELDVEFNYTNLSNIDKKNHLEVLELVDENEEFRNLKVEEYIKNKDNYTSELDKKIQNCLIPQVYKTIEENQQAQQNYIEQKQNAQESQQVSSKVIALDQQDIATDSQKDEKKQLNTST